MGPAGARPVGVRGDDRAPRLARPGWNLVADAFRFVAWEWVVAAIALNLLSVVARAAAWHRVIEQAMPPPTPPFRAVFSAFGVGLFANAVLRAGSASSRASRSSRRHQSSGGADAWATLVGTVFAHRVFDLFPVLLLIGYVLATAKIPHWALTSLLIFVVVGFALFAFALASARHHHRSVLEEAGRRAPALTMARHGLGVMRAPVPAAFAALLQCVGWMCQLFAVWATMRAFDIHAPLPAAGLVLLLMNVAMLFPLWPGNVGLVQAAVALPLVSYGVAYAEGLRVRDRAAGDRDVGRRRRRPDLPRPRGALVRDAEAHAGRGAGRGRAGGHEEGDPAEEPRARARVSR